MENPVLSGTGFWAPGFSSPDDPTLINSTGAGGGYRRNFLNIRISNSIPVYRFHIYNAGGALYGAAERPTATNGSTDGAVLIGSQLAADTWCNVKVHLDSDRLYLRVWPDGSSEPTFYQVQTDATGSTWADQEFELVSRSHLEDSSTPAFTLRVDDLCIGRSSYMGAVLGLPGFAVTIPADTFVIDDWDRAGPSWGVGASGQSWLFQGPASITSATIVSSDEGRLVGSNSGEAFTRLPFTPPSPTALTTGVVDMYIKVRTTAGFTLALKGSNGLGAGVIMPDGANLSYIRYPSAGTNTVTSVGVGAEAGVNDDDDPFWVVVRYDWDNDVIQIKSWADGDAEPDFSGGAVPQVTFTPTNLWVDSHGSSGSTHFDEVYVIYGGGVDTSNCDAAVAGTVDEFDRTEASGLGTSDASIIWTGDDTEGSVDGSEAVWTVAAQTLHLLEDIDLVMPVTLQMRVRHEGVDGNGGISLGLTNPAFDTYGDAQFNLGPGLVTDLVATAELSGGGAATDNELNAGTHGVANLLKVQFEQNGVNAKVWAESDPEPDDWQATAIESLTPISTVNWLYLLVQPGSGNTISIDYIRSISGDCIDCGDAAPGELEEPSGDGPEVGDEPGDRLSGTGDNGGVVYQLNAQYQLGSTEVWVDGLRIRLGADYLEFPRNGKIEILDHIDVGTEGDPASIRVNYIIWTIDDPIPE